MHKFYFGITHIDKVFSLKQPFEMLNLVYKS